MLIVNLHSTPSLEFWGPLTSAEATVEGLHSVCETGMFTLNICTLADGSLCLGIQAKDIYGCLMSSQCHNSNIPVVPWKKVDLCSSAGRSKSTRFLWDNAKQHVSSFTMSVRARSSVWHLFFWQRYCSVFFHLSVADISCYPAELLAVPHTVRPPYVRLVRQGVDESARCGYSGSGGGFDECKTTERLTRLSVFTVIVHLFD